MIRLHRFLGRWLAITVLAGFALTASASAQTYPEHEGYFIDQVGVVTPEQHQHIETRLQVIERETSNEIGVAVVSSLGDQSVDEYANGLFNFWGIGKRGKDNGVLLLIAPNEHRFRIEVGYGLEGDLTDNESRQIINELTPYLKQEAYNDAINTGITRIDEATRTELVAQDAVNSPMPKIFFFVMIGMISIPFLFMALVAFFILRAARRGELDAWRRTGSGYTTGSTYDNSSSSSSSSDSSSSSSFGGGSSGGGGASGSW